MGYKSTKQKRELAQHLYTTSDMTQKQIAEFVDTSETNINRWKQSYKWDELRKARSLTREQLIANAYEQADLIYKEAKKEQRAITSKEADALVKISTQIKNLEKELNAGAAMTVLKSFNEHLIRQGKFDLAKEMVDEQRQFVINLMPGE